MSTPPLSWRQDALSGLGNALAFFEAIAQFASTPLDRSLILIYFELSYPQGVNYIEERALEQLLRWLALALQDEIGGESCYRLRGNQFAALLAGYALPQAQPLVKRVQARLLSRPSPQAVPLLHEAVLHSAALYLEAGTPGGVAELVVDMETLMQQLKEAGQHYGEAHFPLEASAVLPLAVHALIEPLLEMCRMLDQALLQAETDALTGLPNGRAMQRILEESLLYSREMGEPFALLLVDGDNLRAFNTLSYERGDAMIRQLAALLMARLRRQDTVARWRLGDEFLILLPGADAEAAARTADRLLEVVRQAEWELPVTISIGIVHAPQHGVDAEALITQVERALLEAKRLGKNQAVLAEGNIERRG